MVGGDGCLDQVVQHHPPLQAAGLVDREDPLYPAVALLGLRAALNLRPSEKEIVSSIRKARRDG